MTTKPTVEALRQTALGYTAEAIDIVASLMRNAKAEAIRLAAAREVLDRGLGKPSQAITGANGGPIEHADTAIRYVVVDPAASIEKQPEKLRHN